MKTSYAILVFFTFLSFQVYGQKNNQLRGKILYLNSKKQPAVGVKVSGTIEELEKSNSRYSSTSGDFVLIFPNARDGYEVELLIGEEDELQNKIELVNEKEVEQCRIPANSEDIFEIIICLKGARDSIAQKYYKIIKTSSDYALVEANKEVNKLLKAKKRDTKKISVLFDKIAELEQAVDSIAIFKEALKIASINKDNANERVLNYLSCLENGGLIQECKGYMDKNKALEEGRENIKRFKATIQELEMNGSAANSIFDYKEATDNYDYIITLMKEDDKERIRIVPYYQQAALASLNGGQSNKALLYQNEAIKIQSNAFGVKPSNLGDSYDHLGNIYLELGNYKEALKYQKLATIIRKEINDSISLAVSYSNLGNIYSKLSHNDSSLIHHQNAINIQEILKDSIHLANSYNNIGGTFEELGEMDSSLLNLKKSLNLKKRILKESHPSFAVVYNNIANVLSEFGKNKEALDYLKKGVSIQEGVLDSLHPRLATSYNNIALIYSALGDYISADTFFNKSLKIEEAVLDSLHPNLASLYMNIGVLNQNLGKYDTSLIYLYKVLSIIEVTLDSTHSDLATAYNNISVSYYYMNNYNKAIEFQKKSLHINEIKLSDSHPDLIINYLNLASVLEMEKRYTEALEYYLKSISVAKINYGDKHQLTAKGYNNLGNFYRVLKKYDKALYNAQLALSIKKELPDSNPIDIGLSYLSVGNIYRDTGLYSLALINQNLALNIFQLELEKNHPVTAINYMSRGITHSLLNQFDNARKDFESYEEINPESAETYKNWAIYYALKSEEREALINIQKAINLGFDDLEWLKMDKSMNNLKGKKAYNDLLEQLEKRD